MGLFLVHSVEMYETFWAHPDYGSVFQWTFGLFSGKAYAIMALCFGVSFYLIMQGAARGGLPLALCMATDAPDRDRSAAHHLLSRRHLADPRAARLLNAFARPHR